MKKIFYLVIALILFIPGIVKALAITPSSCINGTCDTFPVYLGLATLDSGVKADISFMGTSTDYYQFGVVSVCSSGDIKATSGTYCSDSCFADTFTVQNTRTACTASGNEGIISNIYFQIRKATWGSQTYAVQDVLTITPLNWNEHVSIVDLYLTDNDLSSTISSDNVIIDQNGEIIDNIGETNDKLDTQIKQEEEAEQTRKGILGKLGDLLTGIIELPGKIANLIIDGLKSLFVPTDEQLYEIINDSKELSENFGFVGESMNFFITLFTSLLGMVNENGCLELPEFTIGATTLFESHTFWDAQLVCLNDNPVLSKNIDTIRTITSIVLVGLFIGFASGQFFKILNKGESQNDAAQSILDRYK